MLIRSAVRAVLGLLTLMAVVLVTGLVSVEALHSTIIFGLVYGLAAAMIPLFALTAEREYLARAYAKR